MIKPEEPIHTLLYDNDCVVVPNFGGFIKRKHPTVIDKKHHSIKPKGQTVFFNSALTHHDGLLANCIAEEQNLSYQNALESIADWVKNAEKTLSLHGRLKFGKMGTFFMNQDGKKWFSPDPNLNFSKASYGLETLVVQAITEEPKAPSEQKETAAPVLQHHTKKPKRTLLKIAASLVLLGLFGSAYYFWQYYPQNPFNSQPPVQQATLLTLDDSTPPTSDPTTNSETLHTSSDEAEEIHHWDNPSRQQTWGEEEEKQQPETTSLDSPTSQETDPYVAEPTPNTQYTHNTDQSEYTVLAGAFLYPANAGRHMVHLQSLGFEADSFKPDHSRLTRIVIGRFTSAQEAELTLQNVQQHIPQAHIIDYK